MYHIQQHLVSSATWCTYLTLTTNLQAEEHIQSDLLDWVRDKRIPDKLMGYTGTELQFTIEPVSIRGIFR